LGFPFYIIPIIMVAENGIFTILGLQRRKKRRPGLHFGCHVIDHIARKEQYIALLLVDESNGIFNFFAVVKTPAVDIGYLGNPIAIERLGKIIELQRIF